MARASLQNWQKQPARPHFIAGLATSLLDLIFPPRCLNCGLVDNIWCARCQATFAQIPIAKPVALNMPGLAGIATTGHHRHQLQRMVQALKYERAVSLAVPLAGRLQQQVVRQGWPVDAVVSVPLHLTRYRQRGYNQAELLAQATAELLGLPELTGAIRRVAFTRSQVGLGRLERQANVANAFLAEPSVVAERHILLIDDVLTTGATLAACATALKAAGATAVYGLTVTAADQTYSLT